MLLLKNKECNVKEILSSFFVLTECVISQLKTGVGVSLDYMRNHVVRQTPGLAERRISRDVIHMLL